MFYTPITVSYRVYLWIFSSAFMVLLFAIVALNYVVDPYLIHQWDTTTANRLGPSKQKISPWAKTYAVSRYKPEVVYLGSSRTEIALSPKSPVFLGKRVFNLAIRGGTFGDATVMLNHTTVFNRPSLVVWGLDYGGLFTKGSGNTDFEKDLVANDQYYPFWRTLLNIKRSVSMDMTTDVVKLLMGLSEQSCASVLSLYGQRSEKCVAKAMVEEGGAINNFAELMKGNSGGGKSNFDATLLQLDKVTHDYCLKGTAFRFFIQPIHALDELYHGKPWEQMEDWKRDLVKIIDRRKQAGCDIRLMDFSGFNSITTEEIPQVTGKETLHNYWEASHYKAEVGDKVLIKLFSKDSQGVESDFGVDLNGAVIEAHLAKVRLARDQYCKTHPQETALLKAWTSGNGEQGTGNNPP